MVINMYNLFLIYLILNSVLSIISKVLINLCDEYWKQHEDPPNMNFFKLIMIGTSLTISGKVAYLIGYIYGYIHFLFLNDRSEEKSSNTLVSILNNILLPIVKIFLFLPILIQVTIFEIYLKYFDKGGK